MIGLSLLVHRILFPFMMLGAVIRMKKNLQKSLKCGFAICVIAWSVCPDLSYGQVTDLPAGPYGGMFRDESTGKVWLDYDATINRVLSAKVAFLANTPFRLATRAEVQSIAQASILHGPAVGPYTLCSLAGGVSANCKFGVYDDTATGSNPAAAGVLGIYENGDDLAFGDDAADEIGAATKGGWAIQRGPALRPGTNPFAADFDGDGKDEKIVWRQSNGTWYVRFSGTDEAMQYQWGLPGDVPLVGDYDGDLIPDLVVWRPSNGTWYVLTSKSLFDPTQAIQQQFGLPGDVPMKADFDGDGKLDFVVWRPKEGKWYVKQSTNGQVVVTQWGLNKDIPVTGGRSQ